MLSPIALFCFNRPEHLQRTLDALVTNQLASESSVTFFCDGPRTQEEKILTDAVRCIAHNTHGFASVTVIEREQNMGCAASIINGLQYMFSKYESLIVIEDDILCSPYTLAYLNKGLQLYKDNKKIFNIAAWSPPQLVHSVPTEYTYNTYTIPRFNCWGWASWRDRFTTIDWDVSDYQTFKRSYKLRELYNTAGNDLASMLDAQMDGRINTWDIRVDYARFKANQVGINPIISYTTNIGMGSGTHTTQHTDKFDNDITKAYPVENILWPDNDQPHAKIIMQYKKLHDRYPKAVWKKIIYMALQKLRLLQHAQNLWRAIKG